VSSTQYSRSALASILPSCYHATRERRHPRRRCEVGQAAPVDNPKSRS
jgi:hypothetical protein